METSTSDTLSNDSERAPSSVSSDTYYHAPRGGQLQAQTGEQRCLLASAVQLMGSKHGHHTPAHLQDKWSKIRERLSRIQRAGAHNKRRRESSKDLNVSPSTSTTPLVRSSHNSSCDLRSLAAVHASQSDRLCETSAASACAAAMPSTLSETAARTMSIDLHDALCSAGPSRHGSLQQELSHAHASAHAHRRQANIDSWASSTSGAAAGAAPQSTPTHHSCGHTGMQHTPPLVPKLQLQQQQQRAYPSLKHARSVPSIHNAAREHAHEHEALRAHARAPSSQGTSSCGSATPPSSGLSSRSQLASSSSLQLSQPLAQGGGGPQSQPHSSSQQLLLSGSQQPLVPSAVQQQQQQRRSSSSLVQAAPRSPSASLRTSSNSQALPSWLEATPSAVFVASPNQARFRKSAEHARSPTAAAVMAAGSGLYQQHAAQHVCVNAPQQHVQLQPSMDSQLAPHPPAGKPSRLARLRTAHTLTPVRSSEDELEEQGGSGDEGHSTAGSRASAPTSHSAQQRTLTTTTPSAASGTTIHGSSPSSSSAQQPHPSLPPTPPRTLKPAYRVHGPHQPCGGVYARSSSCQNLGTHVLQDQQSRQQSQQDHTQQEDHTAETQQDHTQQEDHTAETQQDHTQQEDHTAETQQDHTQQEDHTAETHQETLAAPHPLSRPASAAPAAQQTHPAPLTAATLCPTPPRHLQRVATTSSCLTRDARQAASTAPNSPTAYTPTPTSSPAAALTPHRTLARSTTSAIPTHAQQELCTHPRSVDFGAVTSSSGEGFALGRAAGGLQPKPPSREHARLLAHLQTYAPHLMRPQSSGASETGVHHQRHSISLLLSGSSRLDQKPLSPSTSKGGGPSSTTSRARWQYAAHHEASEHDAHTTHHTYAPLSTHPTPPSLKSTPLSQEPSPPSQEQPPHSGPPGVATQPCAVCAPSVAHSGAQCAPPPAAPSALTRSAPTHTWATGGVPSLTPSTTVGTPPATTAGATTGSRLDRQQAEQTADRAAAGVVPSTMVNTPAPNTADTTAAGAAAAAHGALGRCTAPTRAHAPDAPAHAHTPQAAHTQAAHTQAAHAQAAQAAHAAHAAAEAQKEPPLLSCEPTPSWCTDSSSCSGSTSTSSSHAVGPGLISGACGSSSSGCEGPATLFASVMGCSGNSSAFPSSGPIAGILHHSSATNSAANNATNSGANNAALSASQCTRSDGGSGDGGGGGGGMLGAAGAGVKTMAGASGGSSKAKGAVAVGGAGEGGAQHQQAQAQQQLQQQQQEQAQQQMQQQQERQQQQEALQSSGGLRARLMRSLNLGAR